MNSGYVKLHRKILDNPIVMKDVDHLAVWIYLLLNATHKKIPMLFNGKKIMLQPGQLITSTLSISKDLSINKDKIQRILNLFETDKQINQQTSSKGRLISLEKWEFYQNDDKQSDKQMINNCETSDKKRECKNERNIYSTTSRKEKIIKEKSQTSERNGNERNGDENLFDFVEKEFGRTLSNTEAEFIERWSDNELTRYAVKQSALARAFNVRYVDKILFNYEKEGITTIAQAEERDKKFRERKKRKDYKDTSVPNWLDNNVAMEELDFNETEEMNELFKEFK